MVSSFYEEDEDIMLLLALDEFDDDESTFRSNESLRNRLTLFDIS